MKWQFVPANKWLAVIMVALLLFIVGGYFILPAKPTSVAPLQGVVQMGFYDLMSKRKEIYDSTMKTVNHNILTTITSPNDNRFVLKGKFTPLTRDNGRLFFSYTPIFFSPPRKGLMIGGLVDLLLHVDVWMEPLRLNGKPLVVGESGMIFLYPLHS